MNRPPESASIVAPAIAAAAGGRAGTCMIAAPSLIVGRLRGEPGEHRDDVGAVRLRGPDRVEPGRLGGLDDLDRLVALGTDPPVAEVETQLHVARHGRRSLPRVDLEETAALAAGDPDPVGADGDALECSSRGRASRPISACSGSIGCTIAVRARDPDRVRSRTTMPCGSVAHAGDGVAPLAGLPHRIAAPRRPSVAVTQTTPVVLDRPPCGPPATSIGVPRSPVAGSTSMSAPVHGSPPSPARRPRVGAGPRPRARG